MILAYLIEPGRAEYALDDLAAEYGVELLPVPEAEEETAALVRHAAATLRLREPMLERVRERGAESLYREIELPLTEVLAAMESAGVKVDTYRMGEITARLADRVEELEAKALRARGRGVHARLDPAGGADPVRDARPDAGPKGQDRLLDRHARAALDPRRARARRRDRGVARVLEAAQHLPRAAADADRRGRSPAHDLQPDGRRHWPALDDQPEPAGDPDPAPSSAARSARPSSPRRGTSSSRPTTRRSSCASSRTSPASRSCARPSRPGRTSMRPPPPRCSARSARR